MDWFSRSVSRANFDQDIRFSLGAFVTICRIKQEERIKAVIKTFQQGKTISMNPQEITETEQDIRDIEIDAIQVISNLIFNVY